MLGLQLLSFPQRVLGVHTMSTAESEDPKQALATTIHAVAALAKGSLRAVTALACLVLSSGLIMCGFVAFAGSNSALFVAGLLLIFGLVAVHMRRRVHAQLKAFDVFLDLLMERCDSTAPVPVAGPGGVSFCMHLWLLHV